MLNMFFINFKFHSFVQSGCYFDFFYKKFSEVFVSNFFVYSSQFFGEKYMMEFLTKNMFNKSIFILNKLFGMNNLSYFDFFYNMLTILSYMMMISCIFSFFII